MRIHRLESQDDTDLAAAIHAGLSSSREALEKLDVAFAELYIAGKYTVRL